MTDPGILSELRDRKSRHGTVLAVSMMKDEAPYLLEWFAHHLAVGFTDILVYTNDCTDGTVEMLQRLEELGLGFHRENRIPKNIKPQPSAIKHAQKEPIVGDADWVMLFDADEYLTINHPSGHLDGLLDDAVSQGANGVVITWRVFGSGGVVEWSREPVTEQYERAAPPLWNKGWGVKTLFKFDPEYWKLGIHRPKIKRKHIEKGFADTVHWLNGSGQPMEEYFKFRGWRSIRRTVGYDWAQLNHYAVKSVDAYAVRKFRGNVNNKKDKYNADYWSLQDRNEVQDRAIARHAARRAQIMVGLLQDRVLSELHEAALAQVEARLTEFKSTQAYEELKSSLIEASKVPITKVDAKPPKARDPAKIAARMSKVEKQTLKRARPVKDTIDFVRHSPGGESLYADGRIDFSEDMELQWVDNHGLQLPVDPRIFSPTGLEAVVSGKFDRRHARNIATYYAGASRILEIGAGVGFLALKSILQDPNLVVMAQDEREGMSDAARMVACKNGLIDSSRLKYVNGPLRFDESGSAPGLVALLNDFSPDTLRVAEAEITFSTLIGSIPDTLGRIVVPVQSKEAAQEWRRQEAEYLKREAFVEQTEYAEGGSLLYTRL